MQKLTNLVHPEENRALSIAEYKRLQDFPDDWIIKGNRLSQYKQVGNAVPVLLAKAAGITILNHLQGISPTTIHGFKHSRFNDTCENTWSGGIPGNLFDDML
jgi:DNA (cytosine-5)-methyltransferase 1